MAKIEARDVIVPLDVPKSMRKSYIENYLAITRSSGRLMLFAGDQKVEHLNDDFYGPGVDPDDADPEHLFRIAANSRIGVFAAQLGLVARYGMDYSSIPYLIKMNSKTHLVKTSQSEPVSLQWLDMDRLVSFKKNSGLNILGVGYTLYLGSEHEENMLREAARLVFDAHQYGLITVLWVYPRGAAVKDEKDSHLIAGATGVAACLGADFVKVNYPSVKSASENPLKEAVLSAGRTKVVCAGGSTDDPEKFLQLLHYQINVCGAAGNATGRNIHQRSFNDAVRFCNAIYAITVEGTKIEEALAVYRTV